jgi:hypothetical protein
VFIKRYPQSVHSQSNEPKASLFKIKIRSQAILDGSTVFQTQIRDCQEGLNEVTNEMRKAATERTALNERT